MLHRLGPWPSPKPDLSNYPPDTAAPEPDHQRFSELRGLKATLRHEPPRSKDSIQIRTLKNEASQSGVEDFSTDGHLSTEAPRSRNDVCQPPGAGRSGRGMTSVS